LAETTPGGEQDEPSLEAVFGDQAWDSGGDEVAEDQPAATPEPVAAPAAAQGASSDELEKRLAEINEKYSVLERRFHDTQQWGNQANMASAVAQAMVRAQQETDQIQQQLRQRQEQAKFPEIDLGDPEKLLSDPEALVGAFRRYGEASGDWGYRRAVADMSPHVAQMQSQMQLVAIATPLIEDYARDRARTALLASGDLDDGQVDKLLDRAYSEVIAPEQYAAAYRLRPDTIIMAANIVRQKDGAPVKPVKATPKPAPSAGAGSPAATPKHRRPTLSPAAERAARHVQESMGVKFDDNELATLASMNRRA
jgi:hypothetical protein